MELLGTIPNIQISTSSYDLECMQNYLLGKFTDRYEHKPHLCIAEKSYTKCFKDKDVSVYCDTCK